MIKVLITDDEPNICELIKHLIEWDRLGLTLCGVAHDGVTAFELIQSEKPDIVISDIRMSGMDGIALLEKVRNEAIECEFLLVSGYKQFDYAQQAIHFGVTNYLVKPIKKKELNSSLEKAIEKVNKKRGINLEIKHMQEQVIKSAEKDLENFILDIQQGSPRIRNIKRKDVGDLYGIELGGECRIFYGKLICSEIYQAEILTMIASKLQAFWQGDDLIENCIYIQEKDDFVVIGSSENHMPSTALMREKCQSILSLFPKWSVVLGVYELELEDYIMNSIRNAKLAANLHYFNPLECCFEDCKKIYISYEKIIQNSDAILSAMQVLDTAILCEQINISFIELDRAGSVSAVFEFANFVIISMNNAFSGFTATQEISKEQYYINKNQLMKELYHTSSILLMREILCQRLVAQINIVKNAIDKLSNKPIRVVEELVKSRYMEQISLTDAANATELNPVYLSILFKKEKGTNFKDYLIQVRIEKAKQLLREGKAINVIAEEVGYKDVKYFSKLFARVVGVNPTQYKKLYQ